jgi:hypothetical protein
MDIPSVDKKGRKGKKTQHDKDNKPKEAYICHSWLFS